MERRTFNVALNKNPLISMKVIPGHFTTSNAHVNYYLDVGGMKSNARVARDVAREFAVPYLSNTLTETIVCMERTDVIGAYLAEELLQEGPSVINSGGEIHVVAPMSDSNRKLFFQDNVADYWIANRNIILLVTSISSGRTIESALDCLTYYGGKIAGISALFLTTPDNSGRAIHSLFTSDDIDGYKWFSSSQCDMCKAGQKLDAMVSSEGYTKI